jgi:hypothetical protein
MIEPRCLIEEHGRPSLLRDDFAVGENGFTGPPPGPDAPAEIGRQTTTACRGRAHQRASQSHRGASVPRSQRMGAESRRAWGARSLTVHGN